ncbi:MAG: rhomboid family intramembrane serine protease [bacterium]|nr:rhomboid family intramembrane serine protease [bacterium]
MKDTSPEKPCPRCQGSGVCRDCGGSGHIPCPACSGQGGTERSGKKIPCHSCKGTGQQECPPQCPSCAGTGVITSKFQEEMQRKYQPALTGVQPSNIITRVLIVLCLAVYALAPRDLPNILPQPYPYLIWEALVSKANIFSGGEYWRFLTPAFLHGNIWHLGCNMYALWVLGPLAETLLGRWRYLALYLFSAVGGCLLSSYMNLFGGIGASGAIFGVAASIIVMSKRWGVIPQHYASSVRNSLIFILVLGFAMGGTFGFNLDNWGHIGGAAAGAAFTFTIKKL